MKTSKLTTVIIFFTIGLVGLLNSIIAICADSIEPGSHVIGIIGVIIFTLLTSLSILAICRTENQRTKIYEVKACGHNTDGNPVIMNVEGRIITVHGFQFCLYRADRAGLPYVIATELMSGHAVKLVNTGDGSMRRLVELLNSKSAIEINKAVVEKAAKRGLVEPLNSYVEL